MNRRYSYTVLAVCSTVFAFYHAARQVLPPALPLMKDQFGLSYAQAGFVASTYDIGYAMTVLAGGLLADRLRKVPLILAGLIVLSLTLILTSTAGGFLSLSAIRILTGASFGMYFAAAISILSSYFPTEERGKALGIHAGVGAGSGKFLAPLLAGLTLSSLGWRPLFLLVGVPVLAIAFVFWRVVREPEKKVVAGPPVSTVLREVFTSRFLNMLGLCNALTIACAVTLYSFLPLYLVKAMGADLSAGGYAVALLNGIGIPFVPLVGTLSDRFGRKSVIISVSICAAIMLFLFPYLFPLLGGGIASWMIIAGLGLFTSTAFPVIITYAVDKAPASQRSLAVGYVNTYSVVGGSVATILSGYISDVFGVVQVFPFLATLSALAALLAMVFLEPRTAKVPAKRTA